MQPIIAVDNLIRIKAKQKRTPECKEKLNLLFKVRRNLRKGRCDMTNSTIRSEVLKAYPGQAWKDKINKMDDNRVYAIYLKLQAKKKGVK